MSRIEEIEMAVRDLDADGLVAFRAWFAEFDAEQWNRRFTSDAEAGRLDRLADEALDDLHNGRTRDL